MIKPSKSFPIIAIVLLSLLAGSSASAVPDDEEYDLEAESVVDGLHLRMGQKTPFDGILLSMDIALQLAIKIDSLEKTALAHRMLAEKMVDIESRFQSDARRRDREAWEMQRGIYEDEIGRHAGTPAWVWLGSGFLGGVAVVLLTALAMGQI